MSDCWWMGILVLLTRSLTPSTFTNPTPRTRIFGTLQLGKDEYTHREKITLTHSWVGSQTWKSTRTSHHTVTSDAKEVESGTKHRRREQEVQTYMHHSVT